MRKRTDPTTGKPTDFYERGQAAFDAIATPEATPPWRANEMHEQAIGGYSTNVISVSERDHGKVVALVMCGFGDGFRNANLIAATPAMYQFVIEMCNGYKHSTEVVTKARALLKEHGL